jgi:hypothetical protein
MNFNLRMLNCWIGLCHGDDPLPKDISNLGYVDRAVERRFKIATGRECKPELIIASKSEKHALLWEWKDGRTIDLDQLQRYSTVTHDDLVERAFLGEKECATHDPVLVVKEEHVANTLDLLKRENVLFAVIGAFPGAFRSVGSQINGSAIAKLLADFSCDWEHAPVSYVPLDRDSPLEEVAPHVVTLLLQRILRRDPVIRSIDLCDHVCPMFSALAPEARHDIEKKITDVFAAAAKHEFSAYVDFRTLGSVHSSQLSVTTNPFEIGDDKRSRGFRRMKRLQTEFVEGLSRGHRKPPEPTLFDQPYTH